MKISDLHYSSLQRPAGLEMLLLYFTLNQPVKLLQRRPHNTEKVA